MTHLDLLKIRLAAIQGEILLGDHTPEQLAQLLRERDWLTSEIDRLSGGGGSTPPPPGGAFETGGLFDGVCP